MCVFACTPFSFPSLFDLLHGLESDEYKLGCNIKSL